MTDLMFLPSWIIFFLPPIALGTINCDELTKHLDRSISTLNQSFKLREELKQKFDSYVQEDFQAQSEGLFSEINRNAALKVSYARKKLEKLIENQENSLSKIKREYCENCAPPAAASLEAKHAFCDKCPERAICWPSPKG